MKIIYHLCFLFYILSSTIITVICSTSLYIIVGLLYVLISKKNLYIINRFIVLKIWARTCFYTSFSRVKILNKEHIKDLKKYSHILIVNHLSVFDIFLTGFLPFDFLFFSKKEVFKIPFVGWSMKLANAISVDRKSKRDRSRALKEAISKIKEGNNLLLYPEGTRNPNDTSLLPFKPGAFLIAKMQKVPLIPIVVYGTQNILNIKKPFLIKPSRVYISILKPIQPDDPIHPTNKQSPLKSEEKINQIQAIMNKEYQKLFNLK